MRAIILSLFFVAAGAFQTGVVSLHPTSTVMLARQPSVSMMAERKAPKCV